MKSRLSLLLLLALPKLVLLLLPWLLSLLLLEMLLLLLMVPSFLVADGADACRRLPLCLVPSLTPLSRDTVNLFPILLITPWRHYPPLR